MLSVRSIQRLEDLRAMTAERQVIRHPDRRRIHYEDPLSRIGWPINSFSQETWE